MELPSREDFPAEVAKVIGGRFPLVKVEVSPDAFAIRVNDNLASLENLYRIVAHNPQEMPRQIERWIVELLRATEGHPEDAGPLDAVRDRILPLLLPADSPTLLGEGSISQPLVEGLMVAYVIDHDRTIMYIPRSLFEKWNIALDELHEIAVGNLVRKSEEMEAQAAQDESGKVSLLIFQSLDGYDATRLILPTLHARLSQHLGSPFLAAIPNRDILVCFRQDPTMIARLTQQVAEDVKSMPHQITDRLFIVTPDGVAPYLPQ